jgi:uncharacterized Zn finger protein (UPF0148 family)
MFAKRIGECCPKCQAPLIRRRAGASFRSISGDVAYCARCNSAWELAEDTVPIGVIREPAPA